MPAVRAVFSLAALALLVSSCATLPPEPKVKKYDFPKKLAFVGKPDRPHAVVGTVRTQVNFNTLTDKYEESALCTNYFNKGVRDLVKMARQKGADAVIEVESVVFLHDGRIQTFPTPECSDEGDEGQVLLQGVAVKWNTPENVPETPAD